MQPRGLSFQEAAQHCGISVSQYRNWMREGRVPPPWPGTTKIDRIALDRALNKLSGIKDDLPVLGLTDYDRWKAQQAQELEDAGTS